MPDRCGVAHASFSIFSVLWFTFFFALVSESDGRLLASRHTQTHNTASVAESLVTSQDAAAKQWQPIGTTLNVGDFGGLYRLKQVSTGRYFDAYETVMFPNQRPGFEVVTRPLQSAPVKDGAHHSQYWVISKEEGDTYSIMQLSSGRFLMGTGQEDGSWKKSFVLCTRELDTTEGSASLEQRWYIKHVEHTAAEVRILQASSQRYVDAFSTASRDYQAVLEPLQMGVSSQHWLLEKVVENPIVDGLYTITQKATQRQLDAYEVGAADAYAFTAPPSFSTSQQFIVRRVLGQVRTISQRSTGRLLDCYPATTGLDNFAAVMRDYQGDSTQRWLFHTVAHNEFVLQHSKTGRLLEAFADDVAGHGFRALTSAATLFTIDGNSSGFVWEFKRVGALPILDGIYSIEQASTGRVLDLIDPLAPGGYVGGPEESLVTAPVKPLIDQHWIITPLEGDTYHISLNATPAYLNALAAPNPLWQLDHSAAVGVHEPANPSQMWYAVWVEKDKFRLRQQGTGRWLDAGAPTLSAAHGWQVKTSLWSDGDLGQIWTLKKVKDRCLEKLTTCPSLFECGGLSDGCGGLLICGTASGNCTQANPLTQTPYTCTPDRVCECIPKATCDAGPEACGWEPDGCGGSVLCGHYGSCSKSNPASGLPFDCSVQSVVPAKISGAAPLLTAGAPGSAVTPAPSVSAVPVQSGSTVGSCGCSGKTACSPGAQCGNEVDGCGGAIACGSCPLPTQTCYMNNTCSWVPGAPAPAPVAAPAKTQPPLGSLPTTTAPALTTTGPPTTTVPVCVPKAECDEGSQCGMQEDGCGQFVVCGEQKGACTDSWDSCVDNKCVCEPKTCEGICGEIDTGCGKTEICRCGMSNEMCDEATGMCVNIPQPTIDPNLLGEPLPTTTPPPPTTPEAPAAAEQAKTTTPPGTAAEAKTTTPPGTAAEATTPAPNNAAGATTPAPNNAAGGPGAAPGAVVAEHLGPLTGFDASFAPSPAAGGAFLPPSSAPAGPPRPPAPPGLVPGSAAAASPAAAAVSEELYKYYVYYYNFYYYYHWSDLVTKKHVPPALAVRQAAALASEHAQQQVKLLMSPGATGQTATAVADQKMLNANLNKENAQLRERLQDLGQDAGGGDVDIDAAQAAVQQKVLGKQLMDGLIGGQDYLPTGVSAPVPAIITTIVAQQAPLLPVAALRLR